MAESTLEISRKISQCLIASVWIRPETRITDTPEIYKILNPSAPFGYLNGVYRTNVMGPAPEEAIASHFESFKQSKISFRWFTFPTSRPEDLDSIFLRYGPGSVTDMQGLFLEEAGYFTRISSDVTVEDVSCSNLEDYLDANLAGWGKSGSQAERIRADFNF